MNEPVSMNWHACWQPLLTAAAGCWHLLLLLADAQQQVAAAASSSNSQQQLPAIAAAAASSSCQHACRFMDAGSFMHACQLLLMRACMDRHA
jgi:hypothetical protein